MMALGMSVRVLNEVISVPCQGLFTWTCAALSKCIMFEVDTGNNIGTYIDKVLIKEKQKPS